MTKQQPTNSLNDFLRGNAWSILVLIFVVGSFVAMVNFRIMAIEVKANENAEKINQLTSLIERIVVLEEHDKNITGDLQEIKADLKEIKSKL